MALGALAGACQAMEMGQGIIGLVSSAIAGVIVFSAIGGMLALIGFRQPDALWAGLIGGAVGGIAVAASAAPVGSQAITLSMTIGALVGTTGRPLIRLFVGLLPTA